MFMKHKLLYLFTLLFMATSVGWGQNKEGGNTNDLKTETITIGGGKSISCFFAKGKAITISEGTSSGNVKITLTDTGESIEIPSTTHIFGGGNSATVDKTSITMESGTIARIYGGGFGSSSETPGNVTGMASITVKGGVISDLLVGGGSQYAKTNTVSINISGSEEKKVTVECLYAGGFGYPATSSLIDNWDNAVCGTKIVNMTISNAVFPAGIGCGGGQAYTYTGSSTVNIKNATLGALYGTLSNGYADNIDATLIGCTFKPMENNEKWYEIGAINRGKINTVSFSFDGCSFENTDQLDICLGAIEGWGDSDTNGDPAPEITGSIAYSFTGCTNTPDVVIGEGIENIKVELTGAKAKLKKYHRGNGIVESKGPKEWNTFNITNGNWIFNNGLVMNEDVTLTNNGSLSITCPTVDDLVAAVKAKANMITLDAETYSLTSQLVIDNLLELTGKGKTETIITADENWTGGDDAKDLIKVAVTNDNTPATSLLLKSNEEKAVSLSALTIKGAQGNGLVANSPVALEDIALIDNKASGLLVSATTVTATNLTTSGNGESGAKVEKSNGNTSTTKLTIEGESNLGEAKKIVANDDSLVDGDYVKNILTITTEGDNNEKIYGVKTNLTLVESQDKDNQGNKITYVYANGTPVMIKVDPVDTEKIGIYEGDKGDKLVYTLPGMNTQLFGGSKNSDGETIKVASTSITMESGTISGIYGGGDNTEVGDVNITITGGEVTDKLFGGGRGTSATPAVTDKITFNLNDAKIRYMVCGGRDYATVNNTQAIINSCTFDYVLGGGFAPVGNNVTIDSESNKVTKSDILMTGGTINGALLAGGGYSYAHTETAFATLNNVTINGGLYGAGFNGKSDNVTIEANECEFKHKADSDYRTIAALVRGKMETVNMTFDEKCSFEEGYECYIGADQNSENATSANDATFIFKGENVPTVKISGGLQNVKVSGAKVIVDAFVQDKNKNTTVTTFTIPEGKTWAFNNGLEIVKADDDNKQATLTYAANATDDTKAGTLTVGGTMTPAKEDDVTAALKGDKPSASEFDVANLEGWTSDKLAEKLNGKFYAEDANKRTEPFSGIKFICKDGESKVIVYSDKDAANADANPDAKYLVWDKNTEKYDESSVEAKSPLPFTITISGGNATDITSVKANDETLTATEGKYSVYAGQKLIITFQTKDSYSVSAKIGGTDYQNGSEYTVPADVDKLEMKITYTYNPVPDDPTTPDPEPSEDVKLSFDTTEKTVKVGDEFTLNVTVTGAETSRIVWTSSDSNVATVTSDGKIKAVGTGTATITARIGDVEAVCTLTVEAKPTGIEAVSAGTQLYTTGGQIVIIPAQPVQVTVHAVTGVCIYTGRISETLYIPASAGIYLVTLSTDEGEVTEKVNVR